MKGLDRHLDAQSQPYEGFDAALAEIEAGRKRSHWIWYVFPQLAGLGTSPQSRRYAIADAAEARAYLAHDVLRSRYRKILAAVRTQLDRGAALADVMGSGIDAAKLVSSLTLFGHVARELHAERTDDDLAAIAADASAVLAAARAQGWPPCSHTLAKLASA